MAKKSKFGKIKSAMKCRTHPRSRSKAGARAFIAKKIHFKLSDGIWTIAELGSAYCASCWLSPRTHEWTSNVQDGHFRKFKTESAGRRRSNVDFGNRNEAILTRLANQQACRIAFCLSANQLSWPNLDRIETASLRLGTCALAEGSKNSKVPVLEKKKSTFSVLGGRLACDFFSKLWKPV